MKIAVCFSGNIRTGVNAFPNIKRYFGPLFDNIDFFVHTWDLEDVAPPFLECYENRSLLFYHLRNYIPYNLQETKIHKFNQLYNPKRFVVDPPLQKTTVEKPMWVSLQRSLDLMREYENLNNFKYDIVVKLRPDILFHPGASSFKKDIDLVRKNTLVVCNLQPDDGIHSFFIDDVAFFCDNIASEALYSFCAIKNNPHDYLYKHMADNSITVRKAFSNNYTIYRKYLLHLDPIDDFGTLKMREYDLYLTEKQRENVLRLIKNKI